MARQSNQVTLTFAGDSEKLEKSFENVGASAKEMSSDVGSASKTVGAETSDSFGRAGEAADAVDTKAMGFRDTMTGMQDTSRGLAQIMKGNMFEGFLTLGMGVGDLASGFVNFLIPSFARATKAGIANAAQTVRQTGANAAHKVSTLASAAATKTMTVAQRALNVAMRANPIGIVITVLAALGGALVLAYQKSETFRNIVQGAMRGVQTAFGWVLDKGSQLLGWFRDLPGKIGGFFSGLGETIVAPFRGAVDGIKNAWNSTLGGKGFDVPGWVPGIGGNSFRIPTLHQGGIVPGAPGQEQLALLQAGERVTPAGQVRRERGGDEPITVNVMLSKKEIEGIAEVTVQKGNRRTTRRVLAGTGAAR